MKHSRKAKMWPLLLICGVCALRTPAQGDGGIPLPTISGPIPQTAASHAMNAAKYELVPEDLDKYGYVEEEYLVSGKANIYEEVGGAIRVKASGAPYTSRILVRRPKDSNKFSGNIILGPMNPSTNVDLVDPWMNNRRYITEHGDVYVGITAKPIAIQSLKRFDAQRYGSLTMTDTSQGCKGETSVFYTPVAGMENGLIWDMLTQLGALLKSDSTPLKGFKAQYLYMSGGSQTGAYTIRYVNTFHKMAKLADGRPVYDGYLPFIAAGVAPLNQCSPMEWGGRGSITQDAGVPVIRIMSQTDFGGAPSSLGGSAALAARQPDSDDPKGPYRLYEVPGTSHVTLFGLAAFPRPEDFVKSGNLPFTYNCAEPEGIDGRMFAYIFDGALANLDRWVRTGQAPPKASRIEVLGTPPFISAVYDEHGNMKGGVRTPDVDVPVAAYVATSTQKGSAGSGGGCNAMGHIVPFSAKELKTLYPTHGDYVKKVDTEVDRMYQEGWLTKADADQIKMDADRAHVPD
jgi:Alpha/beta hydrolase domain